MMSLHAEIIDVSGAAEREQRMWPPVLVPRELISQTIERLSALPRPIGCLRSARIVHPYASFPAYGFAPGIGVSINVLNPGETTPSMRRNSSQVEICIGGSGEVLVEDNAPLLVSRWDVWNVPAMKTYQYRNAGADAMARLSYSDAPLLESLEAHYVEKEPTAHSAAAESATGNSARLRDSAANLELNAGGWLRGYQYLVDIDVVKHKALHWPWREISPRLPLAGQGHSDAPMGMFLLYNPATERMSGTTPSFFATFTCLKANGPRPKEGGRGHRHNSAAINYHMMGSGYSIVEGQRIEWAEGDLLLSAPGWSEHAHFAGSEEMLVFTVQDHPRHMSLGSLIWQEEMSGPILNLGAQRGFNSTSPRNDIQTS